MYNEKSIKTDVNRKPVPQYYNPATDDYEVLTGKGGANLFHETGTIIKEAFSGTSSMTKTFDSEVQGIFIKNYADEPLTFTINAMDFEVEPDESFRGKFEPFTSVSITATGKFKAYATE